MNSGGQGKPRPVCQEWTVPTPHSAGRTSWPPAMGRSADSLVPTGRSKREVPGMAFSNAATLLGPSSPTAPWTPELQGPMSEPGLSEESEAPARGSLRTATSQKGPSGLRKLGLSQARQPEKPSHPHLEKASSWPHRRDPGRPPEGCHGRPAGPGEGSSKHKGWNRQGLRRPSILPDSSAGEPRACTPPCRLSLLASCRLIPLLSPVLRPPLARLALTPRPRPEGSPREL